MDLRAVASELASAMFELVAASRTIPTLADITKFIAANPHLGRNFTARELERIHHFAQPHFHKTLRSTVEAA